MAFFQICTVFRPSLVMWRNVLIIIILTCGVASSTMFDSTSLLNLKKSFTLNNNNNNALRSWKPGSDPCLTIWNGIICDDKGNVIGIRLENIGLSGAIDVNSLLNVRSLRSISLVNNSFSGPIPPTFNRLVNLRAVQLSGNHFSGTISPIFFDNMVGLKKLWLSYNNFSGGVPVCFGKLTNLEELRLENNSFSGEIPRMELPFLEILAFQNNKLQGEIPENLMRFGQSAFLGNPGLCGPKTPLLCSNNTSNNIGLAGAPTGSNNDAGSNAEPQKGLKLGMMAVGLLVCGLCGIGTIVLTNKKKNNGKSNGIPMTMQDSNCWSEKRIGSRGGVTSIKGGGVDNLVLINQNKGVFGMLDLMRAGAEVMGHGLLGSSYKAMMGDDLKVVVKRVKEMNKVERGGFDNEMTRMGKLRHSNLLPLLGYQYRAEEKLLVSEFVPQGSLTSLLNNNGEGAKFDWPARLKVVKGIAGGLAYLKSELKSSSDVPHGNLKSSNVLIGPDFEPMLVDYGFNTLIKEDQASEALSSYKSPEASITHKVSSKSDVYCLGIIILEILTGKDLSQSDNINEIREQDNFNSELVDKMKNNSKGEMVKLFRIGVNCTNSDPDQRLDLDEAINKITNVQVEGEDLQQPHTEIVPREEHHDKSDPPEQLR